jgi:hypothetical protein
MMLRRRLRYLVRRRRSADELAEEIETQTRERSLQRHDSD